MTDDKKPLSELTGEAVRKAWSRVCTKGETSTEAWDLTAEYIRTHYTAHTPVDDETLDKAIVAAWREWIEVCDDEPSEEFKESFRKHLRPLTVKGWEPDWDREPHAIGVSIYWTFSFPGGSKGDRGLVKYIPRPTPPKQVVRKGSDELIDDLIVLGGEATTIAKILANGTKLEDLCTEHGVSLIKEVE